MKILLSLLMLFVAFNRLSAQSHALVNHAKMTENFADTLKQNVRKVIKDNYDIDLWYQSQVTPDGRLVKPLISRQISNHDIDYNQFLQQIKFFIIQAPVWVPAFDGEGNQVAGNVSFHIKVCRGDITIEDLTAD